MTKILIYILLLTSLLLPSNLLAYEITCSVSTTAAVNFGTINPYDAIAETAQGTLLVTCSKNAEAGTGTYYAELNLTFSAGNSGDMLNRYAISGSNQLQYNIYTDATYSSVLGIGAAPAGKDQGGAGSPDYCAGSTRCIYSAVIDLKNNQPTNSASFTVYARAPVQSLVYIGNYSDTINVLVYYRWWGDYGGMWYTSSVNLPVSATVVSSCAVTSGTLSFGNYSGSNLNATSSGLNVTCSPGTSYTVGLDKGTYGSSVSARQMGNGTNRLNYALYQDAGRTTNWGNTPGVDTYASGASSTVGTGTAQAINIYGKIPSGQNIPTGSYSDTVAITVNF